MVAFATAVLFFVPAYLIIKSADAAGVFDLTTVYVSFLRMITLWYLLIGFITLDMIVNVKNKCENLLWSNYKGEIIKSVVWFNAGIVSALSLFVYLINVAAFLLKGNSNLLYFFRITADTVLGYWVIGMIAVLLAVSISQVGIAGISVLFLVVSAMVFSQRFIPLTSPVMEVIHKYCMIFPEGGERTYDYAIGSHLGLKNGLLILFWFFISLGVFYMTVFREKRIAVLFCMIMAVSLCAAYTSVRVDKNDELYSFIENDSVYYALESDYDGKPQYRATSAKESFTVTEYDMDIDVRAGFNNNVSMSVDNGSLSEYVFTLYHRFSVEDVTDFSGNKLEYHVQGDQIQIMGNGSIDGITMCYCGYGSPCMTGFENVFLPAGFPWYPYPSSSDIVVTEEMNGYPTVGYVSNKHPETVFKVDIKAFCKTFCNIPVKENDYVGKTESLMIVGGNYKSENYKGVQFVYPAEAEYKYGSGDGIKKWYETALNEIGDRNIRTCFFGNEYIFMSSVDDTARFFKTDDFMMFNII